MTVQAPEALDIADWTAVGRDKDDEMGLRAQLIDMNVDGVLDVVGMGQYSEAPTLPVAGWSVLRCRWSVPSTQPDRELSGDVNGERFGRGFGSLGDFTGDGHAELAV